MEREKLENAWTHFRDALPNDAKVEAVNRPVNFADIIKLMNNIEKEWQGKKGKGAWGSTKRYCRRVCGNINSHSTLFKVLPAESQYASVFCGTLQTLIKIRAYSN